MTNNGEKKCLNNIKTIFSLLQFYWLIVILRYLQIIKNSGKMLDKGCKHKENMLWSK